MAASSPLDGLKGVVGRFFMGFLEMIGMAMGGGQAAAANQLTDLQQLSFDDKANKALSAAELAAGVVKGAIPLEQAQREARLTGTNGERFSALVALTGNPPGPETLLAMWDRGIIGEGDVERGMRQGYLKNEWIPAYKQLAKNTALVAQLVNGVVQNQIDEAEASRLAAASGVEPEHFALYVRVAGNPPGPMTSLDLWNRGILTEEETVQALRESRLKNKYIPMLMQRARRLVPMRTVTTLLRNGAIDDARAAEMLAQLGFNQADAQAIITASRHTASNAQKEASVTTIRNLYVERVISRDEASADLARLGYSPTAQNLILQLADSQATARLRNAAVSKLRTIYVSHRMTDAQARADLTKLGFNSQQIDFYLELWSLEESANVAVLTPAQIVGAAKRQIMPVDVALGELVAHGYSQRDATIVMMLGGAIPIPKPGA